MGKFISQFSTFSLTKRVVICLGLLLFAVFPTVGDQQILAAEPDYSYIIEHFEGGFVSEPGFGNVPGGWTVGGPQVVAFSNSTESHHGLFGLHANATYHLTEYSYIARAFQRQPDSLVNLRIQVKASTTSNASAMLRATTDTAIKSVTRYWYSYSSTDWETLTLEDVEIPSNGEVEIILCVGHDSNDPGGSTDFDCDCLTSDVPFEATYDATGKWDVTETFRQNSCNPEEQPGTDIVTITQNGNNVTLVTSEGDTYTGTVNAETYSLYGEPMEDGYPAECFINFALSSGTSGAGTNDWTWTDGVDSCEGSAEYTVTKRTPEDNGDGGGDGGGGGGGGSGGCFIATAAFGSPMESNVNTLRAFRDNYLLPCAPGRIFVRTYYKYSPPVAHFIAKHDILRAVIRIGLLPLIGVSYSMLHFGPVITLTMLVVLLATPIFLVSFYRRKARGKSVAG